MLGFLTTSMSAPAEWNEHGKDVIASGQHKEKLKAYQTWFKRDRFAYYTRLLYMHDDLLREFESCPTAKAM